MRCSHLEPISTLVWSGIFLAIAVAFPAVNLSQQSLHSIQFDAGSGVASNPMQSTASGLMGSSAVSLKGWGHQSTGRTLMHWKGSLNHEAYNGQPAANQFRINGHVGLRRALGDHAETGVEAGVSQGTVWERSLRYREEWRAFDAGHWSGAWWMALRSEGRTGRIYVEKHGWNYGANLGFDRGEFHVGGEVRLPILTRVRGHIRLNKIGQRRTHHMADLVFALHHCEKQFRNWALSEGAVGNGLDFRSAARSAAGSEWMGYRMWSETEGEVRLEVPEHRGLSGGVEMAWRHRVDAVRGTYDEDRALIGAWISGANRAWSGKARCTWNAVHSAGQAVYSEQGWDTYRYNHVVCEGRLERTIRGDVGAFVAGGLQLWRSNALPVGWYQRSDWSSGWIRCGIVWQASTAPRWERRHALKRRIPVE